MKWLLTFIFLFTCSQSVMASEYKNYSNSSSQKQDEQLRQKRLRMQYLRKKRLLQKQRLLRKKMLLKRKRLLREKRLKAAAPYRKRKRVNKRKSLKKKNKWSFALNGEWNTNSNIFRINEDRKASIINPDSDDIASGRYENMNSFSELVFSPGVTAKYKKPIFFKKKMEFTFKANYHSHTDNHKKNFSEYSLGVAQKLKSIGEFKMDVSYVDGFYKRNYLSGGEDANGNGNLSGDERVYKAAIYNQTDVFFSYKPQIKYKDLSPTLFLGLENRSFNSDFKNRNRRSLVLGTKLSWKANKKLKVKGGLKYKDSKSPNLKELVLINETDTGFDEDVNGDGSTNKNTPVEVHVNRSRKEFEYKVGVEYSFNKNIDLSVVYKGESSSYFSSERLDADHFGTTDVTNSLKMQLAYNFKNFKCSGGIKNTKANKFDDDGYNQRIYFFKINYKF